MANAAALKEFIESHTPEQIRLANNARLLLKKLTGKARGLQLQDSRIPKRTRSPLAIFTQDRWATGDLKGVALVDATRIVRKEFDELSATERKVSAAPTPLHAPD